MPTGHLPRVYLHLPYGFQKNFKKINFWYIYKWYSHKKIKVKRTGQKWPVLYQFFHEKCWFLEAFETTSIDGSLILKYLKNWNQRFFKKFKHPLDTGLPPPTIHTKHHIIHKIFTMCLVFCTKVPCLLGNGHWENRVKWPCDGRLGLANGPLSVFYMTLGEEILPHL